MFDWLFNGLAGKTGKLVSQWRRAWTCSVNLQVGLILWNETWQDLHKQISISNVVSVPTSINSCSLVTSGRVLSDWLQGQLQHRLWSCWSHSDRDCSAATLGLVLVSTQPVFSVCSRHSWSSLLTMRLRACLKIARHLQKTISLSWEVSGNCSSMAPKLFLASKAQQTPRWRSLPILLYAAKQIG